MLARSDCRNRVRIRRRDCIAKRNAIESLGGALADTGRPLIVRSGVALLSPGRKATEDDVRDPNGPPFPRDPESVAAAVAANGVRVSVIRLSPSVHGTGETHGFVPRVIELAREHSKSAYIGSGENRWPGVHRRDAARLYCLVLERAAEHAVYHAVADEGVPFREIAEVIARRLNVPLVSVEGEAVGAHFGEFAMFAQIDAYASSAKRGARSGGSRPKPRCSPISMVRRIFQPSSNPSVSYCAARTIRAATSAGCEINEKWLAPISTVVDLARVAKKRWSAGGIALSCVETA